MQTGRKEGRGNIGKEDRIKRKETNKGRMEEREDECRKKGRKERRKGGRRHK